MTFVALAIGAAGAIGGAVINSRAAGKGADAQERAARLSNEEQRRQFDLTRQDNQPFLDTAYGALERQNAYLSGDTSGFMNSADYRAAMEGGTQGINRAAIGNLSGGGTAADLMRFGQQTATQYGNSYWNKLAGQTGQGQQTAMGLGQLGGQMANQIGQNLNNAGQARASSYAAQGNAFNGALQGAAGAFGQYWGSRG